MANWPRYTILRGKVIWANGELKGQVRDGKYLKRGPSHFGKGTTARTVQMKRGAQWL